MTKIRDHLFLGGWSDVNKDELRRNGITAILCLDHNLIPDLHSVREFVKWNCIHIHDNEWPNPNHMVELAATTLGDLLDAHETVLVHCQAGANRAPSIVALHLVWREGGTFEDRWEELQAFRQEVNDESNVMKHLSYPLGLG